MHDAGLSQLIGGDGNNAARCPRWSGGYPAVLSMSLLLLLLLLLLLHWPRILHAARRWTGVAVMDSGEPAETEPSSRV